MLYILIERKKLKKEKEKERNYSNFSGEERSQNPNLMIGKFREASSFCLQAMRMHAQ